MAAFLLPTEKNQKGLIMKAPTASVKGTQQKQAEAERARKKAVDAKNKKAEAENQADIDKLANTPLTDEERAFCLEIEPKMNKGRRDERPCSADILRYSKLIKRKDVKPETS